MNMLFFCFSRSFAFIIRSFITLLTSTYIYDIFLSSKTPPKSVVGFTLATDFYETVAVDLNGLENAFDACEVRCIN